MSMQNRYIQRNYVALEDTLRKRHSIKPPSIVSVRGTKGGAVLRWVNEDANAKGLNLYRNGELVNDKPMAPYLTFFIEKESGDFTYSVSAKGPGGIESPLSVPVACAAGTADTTPPLIVVISPPVSSPIGQPVWVKARLLDSRSYEEMSARLYYRTPGEKNWKMTLMERKVKAVFAVEIPGRSLTQKGLEYYVEASDGKNTSVYPPSSPEAPLSIAVSSPSDLKELPSPTTISVKEQQLVWGSAGKDAFWYRIYRSNRPDFKASPGNFVTYVAAGTMGFKDNGEGFDGATLKGDWYYRVTAVSRSGVESRATAAAKVVY
jgi:hypothetical protein